MNVTTISNLYVFFNPQIPGFTQCPSPDFGIGKMEWDCNPWHANAGRYCVVFTLVLDKTQEIQSQIVEQWPYNLQCTNVRTAAMLHWLQLISQ